MIKGAALSLIFFLAGSISAESRFPGEAFPDFDIKERCDLMAKSGSERIRRMATVCVERENEYKQLATTLWKMADDNSKFECEISANLAFGSYEILSNCLRDQSALLGASE